MGRKPDPNKRQHIIHTAARVFAQKGYAGTRIVEIAEAAGIGKGTVYEYFRSKEDLFFAVFQILFEEPLSRTHNALTIEVGSAAGRLQGVVASVIQIWLPHLELYSLVMEFWSAATTLPSRKRFIVAFQRSYANMRDLVAGLIEQGIVSGEFAQQTDARKIAAAMVGSVDSLLLQAWLDPDFDVADVSRTLVTVLTRGLQAPN